MVVHRIDSGSSHGSNMYLVAGSRTALIDAGVRYESAENIARLRAALKGRGLDMVILTHFHADHTGGLSDIVVEFGAEALAGAGDAPYIEAGDPLYTLSYMFGGTDPVEVTGLTDGDLIDLGEHRLRVVDTPGHTSGGICLYDEATRSLFSGDTVFGQGVGRTDFPSGSAEELVRSLRRLSGMDIGTLYPGHMGVAADGNRAVRAGLAMMGVSV
ncbi:MAG: MBL fold metallo-hydrolase [Methanomassiliicoccaceae archaeon]|nr:MBL fold metallo-hydrolase [Methanomassiliicoccaceae archaeon]MCL2148397.1 MBL fold metallo-hydrolase [Methanomassiliicoccaceae archaeon]